MNFKKTFHPEWCYLYIHIEFVEKISQFTPYLVKSIVVSALKILFGQNGLALQADVLKVEREQQHAILRIHKDSLVAVWSSLTLLSSYDSRACRILILQVSPFLNSLANPSRRIRFPTQLISSSKTFSTIS